MALSIDVDSSETLSFTGQHGLELGRVNSLLYHEPLDASPVLSFVAHGLQADPLQYHLQELLLYCLLS